MKCPICGERLAVIRTDSGLADSLVQRKRVCRNSGCSFTAQTYEELTSQNADACLDQLIDLIRQVAKGVDRDRVNYLLGDLCREFCGGD